MKVGVLGEDNVGIIGSTLNRNAGLQGATQWASPWGVSVWPLSEPSKPESIPSYLEAQERYLSLSLAQVFCPSSLRLTIGIIKVSLFNKIIHSCFQFYWDFQPFLSFCDVLPASIFGCLCFPPSPHSLPGSGNFCTHSLLPKEINVSGEAGILKERQELAWRHGGM